MKALIFTRLLIQIHEHIISFEFANQHIWATFKNQMGAFGFVTRLVFVEMVPYVKRQCEETIG
jgi:hypothetical protein